MNHQKSTLRLFAGLMLAAAISIATGCANKQADKKKLPKLDYHRPVAIQVAVDRMRELVAAIVSEDPLPAPIEYSVKEVIHGTGASSHSHYYLISEDGDEHEEADDHGHEDMESSEVRHEVQIDALTEFYDIVRWLPDVATREKLEKERWNAVNKVSKEMTGAIELLRDSDATEVKKRELVRTKSEQIQKWIDSIEGAIPANDASQEKS